VSEASRKAALEALADRHEVERDKSTSAGEDLLEALEAPSQIARWCAVTSSPEHGTTYLYPDSDTAQAAKQRAVCNIANPTFSEAPVEVVDLDSGKSHLAEVGVVVWSDDDGSPNFGDALATFKDAGQTLLAAWRAGAGGEDLGKLPPKVAHYPGYLPSFDEFVADFAEVVQLGIGHILVDADRGDDEGGGASERSRKG
jgi:hypothetical protein